LSFRHGISEAMERACLLREERGLAMMMRMVRYMRGRIDGVTFILLRMKVDWGRWLIK
jgi:hypothetical protein